VGYVLRGRLDRQPTRFSTPLATAYSIRHHGDVSQSLTPNRILVEVGQTGLIHIQVFPQRPYQEMILILFPDEARMSQSVEIQFFI
jgi:hypothetical protein